MPAGNYVFNATAPTPKWKSMVPSLPDVPISPPASGGSTLPATLPFPIGA